MKRKYRMKFVSLFIVAMLAISSLPSIALASASKTEETFVPKVNSVVKGSKKVGSAATVTTLTSKRDYYDILGICVATHWASTQWTWSGGYLYSSPKGCWNSYWTAPLFGVSGQSSSWNWFSPGWGGSGQSNNRVTFYSGISTDWFSIYGGTFTSRCLSTVNGWGGWSVSWTP